MTRFFLLSLVLFLCVSLSYSQTAEHVPGQILVSLQESASGQTLEKDFAVVNNTPTRLIAVRQVSPYMNIWLLAFDDSAMDENEMLRHVANHSLVEVAQFNHVVHHRAVPNDALFDQQWQYVNDGSNGGVVDADIDADEAWEITTGGLTPFGDEITVAVLDDGIDLNHPDFEDNLWTNTLEIPDNGIDDDGNGYIDDFRGWSTVSNNDNIAGGSHGTPVAGIIGAKGNNGIGVTGVNWDVKVMVIKNNFNTNEAAVISAYSYALTMRELYNETAGEQGAFVVATNASWGVNFGNPDNAPLWCEFYNVMGTHGILSCGATANLNINVDVLGDLPTACPSDFLIAVTNCDNTDTKVSIAGYGAESIDLGAHGANAYTTSAGQSYGGFGGTSGATPHVAGAIALLYSAPCPSFAALAMADPEAAALLARQYILEGVDPNASLEGITVTGGRLNLKNSLDLLMADCATSGCFTPYGLSVATNYPDYILTWSAFGESQTFDLRYRLVGAPEWNTITGITGTSHTISGLDLCEEYEFQVVAHCATESSDYSSIYNWTSDGCCEPPVSLVSSSTTETTITVDWSFVLAAESYDLQYRPMGTSEWETIADLTSLSETITGLFACTPYAFRVRTICAGNTPTEYTPILMVTTDGCGSCITLPYCAAYSSNSIEEWIDAVELNTLNNLSGNDNGYGDYTHLSTELIPGMEYELSVTPGFSGSPWDEYITAWIDFNQNGVFDNNEKVLDTEGTTTTTATATFEVPEDATPGGTRMRITMQFDAQAESCLTDYNFGEVEDYCILIADTTSSVNDSPLIDFSVYPNPARDLINIQLTQTAFFEKTEVRMINAIGHQVLSQSLTNVHLAIDVAEVAPGIYFVVLLKNDHIIARKPVIITKN